MATYTDNYNLTKPTFAESADIRTINGNMDTIDAVMHASQVSLADAYDETRTASNPYNTGDIVMYELLMYKCLGDGVYGTWDGTKWERTTAGANGGGSDVEVTPSYNSGTKIAEIDVDGNTEEIYVPEMTGASSSSDGTAGLPPAPEAGDEDKFLKGDGTWAEVGGGADYVELTQAEYDALSPAEKNNGKLYFITDGDASTASGGSGGSFNCTKIWELSGGAVTNTNYTFDNNHTISEYDFLEIILAANQDISLTDTREHYIVSVESVVNDPNVLWTGYGQRTTTLTIINTGFVQSVCSGDYETPVQAIYGIKTGSGGSSGGSSEGINYSTDEQDTGIKWIDGKTIYQKTIYSAGGVNGLVSVAHSISGIDQIISCEGICYDTFNDGQYMPLARISTDGNNIGISSIDATYITYSVPSAFNVRIVDVYITLKYTKSL